ncbi:hypothetical protein [Streptomyces fagopyri]|uniref:hypothetical protein n=1 Tax=Streptomyces fagopyri TaxID=2662397 RepID=UPI0033DB0530
MTSTPAGRARIAEGAGHHDPPPDDRGREDTDGRPSSITTTPAAPSAKTARAVRARRADRPASEATFTA